MRAFQQGGGGGGGELGNGKFEEKHNQSNLSGGGFDAEGEEGGSDCTSLSGSPFA